MFLIRYLCTLRIPAQELYKPPEWVIDALDYKLLSRLVYGPKALEKTNICL